MLRMQVDPLKNLINTTLLTYADVCWRMLTYATYAGGPAEEPHQYNAADVCRRMQTYAHVCYVCRWTRWRTSSIQRPQSRCCMKLYTQVYLYNLQYILTYIY
jgi:hypothetical protein